MDRTFRGRTTSATDFQLSVLTKRHPDYLSVKEQFHNSWQKPETPGGVSVWRIFKVQVRRFLWLMGIKEVREGRWRNNDGAYHSHRPLPSHPPYNASIFTVRPLTTRARVTGNCYHRSDCRRPIAPFFLTHPRRFTLNDSFSLCYGPRKPRGQATLYALVVPTPSSPCSPIAVLFTEPPCDRFAVFPGRLRIIFSSLHYPLGPD